MNTRPRRPRSSTQFYPLLDVWFWGKSCLCFVSFFPSIKLTLIDPSYSTIIKLSDIELKSHLAFRNFPFRKDFGGEEGTDMELVFSTFCSLWYRLLYSSCLEYEKDRQSKVLREKSRGEQRAGQGWSVWWYQWSTGSRNQQRWIWILDLYTHNCMGLCKLLILKASVFSFNPLRV